ncbi:hypothetical protein ACWD26_29220 [Streptomyces sp. NPDC002787]
MTTDTGSPQQDRADYQKAQSKRDDQSNRVSGLGYDVPPAQGSPAAPPMCESSERD